MKSFKQFLLEAEVKPFDYERESIEGILKLLQTDYSDAWGVYLSGGGIYRGWKQKIDMGVYRPSSGTRKSQNTSNYYTTLFDTNPANSKYPKRSKSFICSTNKNTATAFSDYNGESGTTVLVLPINGGTYGVVPASDIWNVRLPLLDGQRFYYDKLNEAVEAICGKGEITYQDFVAKLDSIKEGDEDYNVIKTWIRRTSDPFDFIKLWKSYYTFDECGFTILNSGDATPDRKEVWISDDCIQIPLTMLPTVEETYKSRVK